MFASLSKPFRRVAASTASALTLAAASAGVQAAPQASVLVNHTVTVTPTNGAFVWDNNVPDWSCFDPETGCLSGVTASGTMVVGVDQVGGFSPGAANPGVPANNVANYYTPAGEMTVQSGHTGLTLFTQAWAKAGTAPADFNTGATSFANLQAGEDYSNNPSALTFFVDANSIGTVNVSGSGTIAVDATMIGIGAGRAYGSAATSLTMTGFTDTQGFFAGITSTGDFNYNLSVSYDNRGNSEAIAVPVSLFSYSNGGIYSGAIGVTGQTYPGDLIAPSVPELNAGWLLAAGLIGIGAYMRQRRPEETARGSEPQNKTDKNGPQPLAA